MNPKNAPPPPPAMLTPNEVYYILSRHKWLIISIMTVALIAAGLVRALWPMRYTSNAALMIKYIRNSKPPVQNGADSQVTSVVWDQENIINSELKILASYDLATNVVGILTPARILAKEGGGTNRNDAATFVQKNLKSSVIARSDVIELTFSHRDSDMASVVLKQVIEAYLKMHNDIRRPEDNDFLMNRIDSFKGLLHETDDQLRQAKARASIVDIDDKKSVSSMKYRTQQEIYDAEADLQGHLIAMRDLENLVPKSPTVSNAAPQPATGPAPVPAAELSAYQRVRERLASLKIKQQSLLDVYTPTSSLVTNNEAQIALNEAAKRDLEAKYPALVTLRPVESAGSGAPAFDPMQRFNEEKMKADEVALRIKVLTNQLAEVQTNAANISAMEGTIMELEHDRQKQEASLEFYSQKLDENNAAAIFAEGNSNIVPLEYPTPAVRDDSKLNKAAIEIVVLGFLLAFGLPFLIELVFDRSIKNPSDIKNRLPGLPFFICIPQISRNGKARALKSAPTAGLLADAAPDPEAPKTPKTPWPASLTNGQIALWEENHALQPFYETLRDRLMTFFEMINLTHKPKLVAVTSCASGAGVTTTAAGLASSLSETGDGNVLLVNMNVRDGEAHHFYKGKLTCGLDEVLEKETRGTAYSEGNLYLAREKQEDDRLPRVLPKRFSHLLPKMKASDFDYIIFDMPPVNQISITPRLARFMDMVLLVVESEKTDRDTAKRVATLLTESKANVGVVLNKNKEYLPKSREQDI